MNDSFTATAARIVRESRAAQGLPPTIEDPRAVARVLRGIDSLAAALPAAA